MDEPLRHLMRNCQICAKLAEIQHEVGITYRTHDQEEAMAISDQTSLWKMGSSNKSDEKELYHKPANEFVATLLDAQISSQPNYKKKRATVLISSSQRLCLPMPALDRYEQAVLVASCPKEFIRWIWDIEGIISDSVYLAKRRTKTNQDSLCLVVTVVWRT